MGFIPEVSIPIGMPEVPGIDFSKFKPSLIPEEARPLVLAPIYLTKVFSRAVVWTVLVCIGILAIIFGTIPAQISIFGFAAQVLLTLLAFAVFALAMVSVHRAGKDIVGQLDLLERMAAGEVTAAFEVAQLLAVNSAGAAGNTANAVVDGVKNFDAGSAVAGGSKAVVDAAGAAADASGAALQATANATGEAASATAKATQNAVGGIFSAVANPRGAVSAVASFTTDAASGAMDTAGGMVSAAMEMNPLYAFEKIIKQVLRVCLYLVCATPPVLFLVGWLLWKLGIHINGLELMVFGLLLGVVAPVCWLLVSKKVKKMLDHAGGAILEIHAENAKKAAKPTEKTPLFGIKLGNPLGFLPFFNGKNRQNDSPV